MRKVADMTELEGVQLTGSSTEFEGSKTTLLQEIEKALSARFGDFSSSNMVLSTRIADLKTWPTSWEQLKGVIFGT